MKRLIEILCFIVIAFIIIRIMPESYFNSFVANHFSVGDGEDGGDNLTLISAGLQILSSLVVTSAILLVCKKIVKQLKGL